MRNIFYIVILILIASCSASKKASVKEASEQKVMITTDYGTMVLKLYNKTPLHRDNFIKLIKQHFYDSLLFHRVIKGFMIQGGDPESKYAKQGQLLGEGSPKYTIPAEFDSSLFHKKGALAAAREADADNPQKRSSSTQFYIVDGKRYNDAQMDKMEEKVHIKIPENHRVVYRTIGGDPFLDMNYTVFGEVISGLDVIDKIAEASTDENSRPLKNIRMKITLLK
ncbi:peptidylprolyl isomerase [Ginsengibacter hankyongi]|uniref:peptidylprolyl isomerase n=1 Tax=Ginsengibacter hankyongi TaxID=2607284 RepID=A0A5J5IMY5_9BACT|nr:peptidylprolyl isomerase [Ginsengibacter hankyongi]KAA9041888.1 peptidylprolyl isomerase [Ginsengibacter hankyongi]